MKSTLTFVACALLSACGPASRPPLTALIVKGPSGEQFKQTILELNEKKGTKSPHWRIDVSAYQYDELYDKLDSDLSANPKCKRPTPLADLVVIDDPWLPHFLDKLTPLPDTRSSGLPENCLNLCREGPHQPLRALPLIPNVQMMFYNQELWKDPPPTSWEDLMKAAKQVSDAKRAYGYVVRAASPNSLVADFLPLLWGCGGDLDLAAEHPLEPKAATKALSYMLALAAYSPPGYSGFEGEQVARHMQDSTAAFSLNWLAWKNRMPSQVHYADLPGPASQSQALIGIWALGIPANAPHPAAALEFLTEAVAHAEGAFKAEGERIGHGRPRPRTPRWRQIERSFGFCLAQANLKLLSPPDAIECAQILIRRIVQAKDDQPTSTTAGPKNTN